MAAYADGGQKRRLRKRTTCGGSSKRTYKHPQPLSQKTDNFRGVIILCLGVAAARKGDLAF